MTLRESIRRATLPCKSSRWPASVIFLNEDFPVAAKTRLIHRGMSVTALAEKIRKNRATVSLVINQHSRKFPKVEAAIRKELGL